MNGTRGLSDWKHFRKSLRRFAIETKKCSFASVAGSFTAATRVAYDLQLGLFDFGRFSTSFMYLHTLFQMKMALLATGADSVHLVSEKLEGNRSV